MILTAECEPRVDYAATAEMMTLAFAVEEPIAPERLEWLYDRSFSSGTTVIALRDGPRKVGQIALVRQTLQQTGERETAAQLVDLFIIPGYRGRQSLKLLYDEVERQFIEQKIRFAVGMPNAKALSVNAHFFHLQPYLTLPFSMGISLARPASVEGLSFRFNPDDRNRLLPLLAQFGGTDIDNGLVWNEIMLFDRLSRPANQYGIHVFGNLLLISSPRRSRGIDHTLLCGFLVRPGHRASQTELDEAVRAACRMWGYRLFVYVGVNNKLPRPPGLVLPQRVRPSPMLVQLRDFRPDKAPMQLDRYELIDFDFA
ncbi:MAG TPA: GNAT family N-acetyltransferase [Bradyrhizobium sp.]|nr:GNAT family N-acetyltransferase [Bradyrhizobium sp.]